LAEIARNNKLKIITIGAGFDTRPYRLAGGNWLEIDEPEIISYKNKCLPTDECPNPLRRISIDFAHASLADVLDQESSREYTAFVIEGVFMYRATDSIKNTINTIQSLFPEHVLYCDLMTNKFFTRFSQSIHAKLVTTGGEFTARPEFPEAIFTQYGYKSMERVPMFKYARELGILRDEINMPLFVSWLVLNVFLKDLGGYAVHRLYFANN
jgi:O-methyltransferase involved in polyketide biosynthesis